MLELTDDVLLRSLSECDAEPVHIPAAVQPFGTLLVVDSDLTIRHCGGAVVELLGLAAEQVVGRALAEWLPRGLLAEVERALREAEQWPGRPVVAGSWEAGRAEQRCTVQVHVHAGRRFVEVLDWGGAAEAMVNGQAERRPEELSLGWADSLTRQVPLGEFFETVADDLRRLGGYDRVMIYQFDEQGNGTVVAESMAGHLSESFLRHRFPASDIPPRSRELYRRNPYRIVADVQVESSPLWPALDVETGEPIDLSHAVLRAVPLVHRLYLANMGVRSSFVVPLLDHDWLWGLIACHHYSPRLPSEALRQVGVVAGNLVSARISQQTTQARLRVYEQAEAVLTRLEARVGRFEQPCAALVEAQVGLAEWLEATGLAVVSRDEVYRWGQTPAEPRLRELAEWLTARGQEWLVTTNLGRLNPAFADLRASAAGLLAVAIGAESQGHWLLALRPEQTVELLGAEAAKPEAEAESLRALARLRPLTPQHSQALWRERVRGVARSWSPAVVELVQTRLRPVLLRLSLMQSQRRTQRVEERLRLIEAAVENVGDVVLITDAELAPPGPRIVYANPATERITGYQPQELIGLNPRILQGPLTDHATRDRIRTHLRRGEPVQAELINYHKSGSTYWIELCISPIRDATGRITHFTAVQRDITERKRLEASLAESNRLYQTLTASMRDVIAIISTQRRLLYISPSVTSLLGWTPAEMLGAADVREFVHPNDLAKWLENLEAALAGRSQLLEWRCRRQDGSYVWVETLRTALKDASGAVTGTVCCMRDISERKRLEAELSQTRKLEAVGQLAGGIAHDFNNLLTVVNGCAELLLGCESLDARQRALVQDIAEAGRRGSLLTRQLLTFARRHVREPQLLAVNEQIERFSVLLRRLIGEDITVTLDLDPQAGTVEADPREIDQIVLNLAVNARDAMPGGGQLTIQTGQAVFGASEALPHPHARPGAYAVIRVIDTGTGIAPEIRERIFEPFFTTKPEGQGTGLGLATVYGIVQQSGGFITVESELGRGATFLVFLPQVQTPAPTAADQPSAQPAADASRLAATAAEQPPILLVEDDPGVRAFVLAVLRQAGHRVLTAESGSEALTLGKELTESPGLIVTDVSLPGFSGPDLMAQLTQLWPGVQVIFISGYTADKLPPLEALPYSATFLNKPFTKTQLLQTVAEALADKANLA